MAREHTIIGLDIGTHSVQAAVAKYKIGYERPQIIGVSSAPSVGIRRGVVVDVESATKSIKAAVEEAQRLSGVKIESAYVSFGDVNIGIRPSKGVVAVSRANSEISEDDISRVIGAAEAISLPQNREILHIVPKEFVVDGEGGIKDPLGMRGIRLELNALVIDGSTPFIRNLTKCVEDAGIEIEGLILGSLAAARASLTKKQKELGVLCLDIGGYTTGITVFEEGDIVHTAVLPIGSSHITNDIAICLKIPVDLAETIKLQYGVCVSCGINKKEIVDFAALGYPDLGKASKKDVAEIIEARLIEIFELTNKELKKVSKAGLLPGGAVLVGGGAAVPGIIDLSKKILGLPAQMGTHLYIDSLVEESNHVIYSTAIGLILWSYDSMQKNLNSGIFASSVKSANFFKKAKWWFKNFLP